MTTQDQIDVCEAVAEYFNLPACLWTEDFKVAAGQFIMKEVALRLNLETAEDDA